MKPVAVGSGPSERSWRLARWVVATTFLAIGLWLLNGAALHSWLSWGPPTPNPDFHRPGPTYSG
jgi:hypothetical protein